MDENNSVQNLEEQGTTPDIQADAQEVSETANNATAPQEQLSGEETTARAEESGENPMADDTPTVDSAPYLTVQYNHETKGLTREEAILLAQKGMKYDAMGVDELHRKLDYAASLSGTDVNTLIERIIKAPEEAHRKHLEELYGEDTESIEIGMEIFRKKQGETYEKIVADRASAAKAATEEQEKSTQSRLAEEYIELKREIPDAPEYAQLPDVVIVEAASGKRDLMSCYLRYLHRENQKITAANATAQEAAKASAGTMGTDTVEPSSADAFIKGLRSI